jgi:cation transport ATPase
MKNLKFISIIAIILVSIPGMAQDEEKATETKEITIKSSVVCDMCKDRVEHNMAFEKGVKSVTVNLETKEIEITYRADKTDPDKLRKAVSKIGYDADDVEADPKAYEKLPKCCKKDAPPH